MIQFHCTGGELILRVKSRDIDCDQKNWRQANTSGIFQLDIIELLPKYFNQIEIEDIIVGTFDLQLVDCEDRVKSLYQ